MDHILYVDKDLKSTLKEDVAKDEANLGHSTNALASTLAYTLWRGGLLDQAGDGAKGMPKFQFDTMVAAMHECAHILGDIAEGMEK